MLACEERNQVCAVSAEEFGVRLDWLSRNRPASLRGVPTAEEASRHTAAVAVSSAKLVLTCEEAAARDNGAGSGSDTKAERSGIDGQRAARDHRWWEQDGTRAIGHRW